jgi:hypothetical protein
LNLSEPAITSNGTKVSARIGFATCVVRNRTEIFPNFSVIMISASRANAANKNFRSTSLHKFLKTRAMLSDSYIENKNKKKKFPTIPKNRARLTTRLITRSFDAKSFGSKNVMLAMKSGAIVRLNVIKALMK